MHSEDTGNSKISVPSIVNWARQLIALNARRGNPDPHPADSEFSDAMPHKREFSGGYNEAFVIQFWVGYSPRH